MLALGLNIVVGYTGLLDMGFIAFYAVGAYLAALLASPHLREPNGLLALGGDLGPSLLLRCQSASSAHHLSDCPVPDPVPD
jgi:ABC-type branched-subunit amino acid transport system permease subunit